MNVLSLVVLITAVLYISCQKDIGSNFTVPEQVVPVTASLSGRITDIDHLPVKEARVNLGAATTTTDLNGYFYLKGISINNPNLAFVKVSRDGFFTGSRTYRANAGSNEYVAIQLIRKSLAGTFASTSGGTVNIPDNGGKIDFPASGIVNAETNTPYSGTTSVSGSFINPAAKDFQEMMPGTLKGISSKNTRVGLQSFSMVAVELSGTGNEKLQIAAGKSAVLEFPIPTELRAQAPATIPLWSFNDTTGIWKEEGTATRQGSNYIGTVHHFSLWTCSVPAPVTSFKAIIVDQHKIPVSNRRVLIKTTDDGKFVCGYGYTDSEGLFTENLPAGKRLELMIYNRCGDSIHTQIIGPLSGTTNQSNITVNTIGEKLVTFSGTAVNCLGAPVTSGVVSLEMENMYTYARIEDGKFSFSISRCNVNAASARISALDNSNSAQAKPVSVSIAANDVVVSVGSLTACGDIENEFFKYSMYSESGIFETPADSVSFSQAATGDYLIGFARRSNQSIFGKGSMSFAATTTNTTTLLTATIDSSGHSYKLSQLSTIRISENGPIGGFIAGDFSAYVHLEGTMISGTLWGRFRIKRKY